MIHTNWDVHYQLAQERHQEFLREACIHQLTRLAQGGRPRLSLLQRVLAWLGRSIAA